MTSVVPALFTRAHRNPTKAVQPTRKCVTKSKSRAVQASNALGTAQHLQKAIALNADIDTFYDYKNTLVESLVHKHSCTSQYICRMLSNCTQYATKRAPSLRNAIFHDLSAKAREEEYEELRDSLSDKQKSDLIKQLVAHRELKHVGIHTTNKAAALDVVQNANHIGDVMMDMYKHTGAWGIALFMCEHPDDPAKPCFSCTHDKALKNSDDSDTVKQELAELLTATLHKQGQEQQDPRHGWPPKVPMQRPSKMRTKDARTIRNKLRSRATCWVALTRTQCDEIAEEIHELCSQGMLKQRKECSNRGATRGPQKNTNNNDSDAENSGKDNSDNEEDNNEDQLAPTCTHDRLVPYSGSVDWSISSGFTTHYNVISGLSQRSILVLHKYL
ncbi:hypothetical protein B0H19DRAFT_1255835 [Mycena capillaripes]|nr:hypothetical protein B0H19DRAFT_1255835 [Mycena capillaripes]